MAGLPLQAKEFYANTFSSGRNIIEKARRRAISAEVVAQTDRHALEARRPKTCYVVGVDARMAVISQFLPSRLIDWVVRKILARHDNNLKYLP